MKSKLTAYAKVALIGIIFWALPSYKPVYNPLEYSQVANPVRTLNTAFQVSTTKWTMVSYTVAVASVITVGQGIAYIDISPDNATWTNITSAGETSVGLLNTKNYNIAATVPPGYYARIRTVVTGGATVSYVGGQDFYLP